MPERIDPALRIVADLHLEVGDDRGRTSAHLTSGPEGLVLDMAEPSVLLRSVPGRGFVRDLPITLPPELCAGTSVVLRSRGHDLGRARLSSAGKIRFRPTGAGLVVAGRTALSYGVTRQVLGAGAVAAVAVVVVRLLRRPRR